MKRANNYRLPKHVVPQRYEILLRPDLEKFTFSGEETMYLTLNKRTKEIVLHAAELVISNVAITDEQSGENVGAKVSYRKNDETVVLTFSKMLTPGKKNLHLTFTGILNDKMRGFYRSKYFIGRDSLHMAVTQFESTDARRAFPCIDEPAAKAIFDVTLNIPSNTTAISNTIETAVSEDAEGYKVVRFAPTPKMSTYLLAFIVGQFESVEKKTRDGIVVRVFATPGKKEQAKFALDAAAALLEFYNDYFDFRYPLPVLDLIAIPDFSAGAMENWGAVTFRESALLIDSLKSSLANRQQVALIIAHELAHMWFGNLATMEWWTHLWLNEGFATFMSHAAVDKVFPQWQIWNQFVATEHAAALSLDGLKNSHPIEVVVHHPREIGAIFDEVSYAKGASVLYMLWKFLGEEDFRRGLQLYLKTFAYKNAATEDLWNAFEKASKKEVAKIMRNWTQKPGYPVVSIASSGESFTLSQKRFFESSVVSRHTKDKTIWHIPLTILSSDKKEERLLFAKKTTKVVRKNADWFKLNSGEAGVMRVAYPHGFLLQFQDAIAKKSLETVDRLGLMRDSFDMAKAGISSTFDALTFCKNYKNEDEYIVWLELADQIGTIYNLIAEDEVLQKNYQEFARNLFSAIAKKVGWEKKLHEKHEDTLLRGLVLSSFGKYGDKETVKKAQGMFALFIKGKKQIDPDIRGVMYSIVARNADSKTADTLFDLYKKEEMHQEKDRIAAALTMMQEKRLIERVLAWSISKDVRAQDTTRIIFMLFLNPKARDLTWKFMVKNWKRLHDQFAGSHGFSRLIEAAREFTTIKKAREIEQFFKKNPTPELERTIRQVVEQVEANADWLKRDRKEIATFLASYKK